MHDSRAQTELRLRRFVAERIEPALYRQRVPLTVHGLAGTRASPSPFEEAAAAELRPSHR